MKSISDYENINSLNPLYLIIGEVDGYIEEGNGNKYLTFASTDKSQEVFTTYTELWDEVKYQIKIINGVEPGEYDKDFMKIRFESNDDLPSNKMLKPHNVTVIIISVFEEYGKYYP